MLLYNKELEVKPQFPNDSAEFVYVRTYARWLDNLNRREFWPETVDRYISFISSQVGNKVPINTIEELRQAILNFEVMPSMRAMWAAGPAAASENLVLFNCAFRSIDSIESFGECLYVLMCGAGFGFDVTKESISKLPVIPAEILRSTSKVIVRDSREGWAESVNYLISSLYQGQDILIDYSKVRKRGSRLMTMGGRASGPEPLVNLHRFIRETFKSAKGRKLKSIECHDICNVIAETVVVGGVRRSSEISLSDLSDPDMRSAKSWPFPQHRAMANNSVLYTSKPTREAFDAEWRQLQESGTGERGIINLEAIRNLAPKRRVSHLIYGINPCAEIALRSDGETCNLSEAIIRPEDTFNTLANKVIIATIMGCIQATFSDFKFLSPSWKKNTEEERLLGVSLTGIYDNLSLLTDENLASLKRTAVETAAVWSNRLGINMPAAVTCVKPSGTVSLLTNAASGMHPRYSDYYVRRFRISDMDPLFKMMRDQGFEFVPEVGQGQENATTWVCEFPVKAPEGSVTSKAVSAIDQLEMYLKLQRNWAEHNSSLTVYVDPCDWDEVKDFVWKNWDEIKGIALLPKDNGHYELAPYSEITKEEYESRIAKVQKIDYSVLRYYEQEDNTEGAKALACSGTSCEIK